MALGFLGNILGKVGSGIGKIGGGIKTGLNRLGEMQGDNEDSDSGGGMFRMPPMTPGINPSAPMPAMKGRGGMFGKGIDLINRQQAMPNNLPQLERPDAPKFEPIRDTSNVNAQLPAGQIGVTPQQTQTIPERSLPNVRIPDFLGAPGATKDFNPMNRAEYDFQTQYMKDGHVPVRGWDVLANLFHGASEGYQRTGDIGGALGGLAAGGVGTVASPLHGRQYRFENEQRPRLLADEQRSQQSEDRGMHVRRGNAEIAGIEARNKATIAGMKDADIERRKAESTIALNEARRQAAITGQAKTVEVVGDDGQVHVVRVNNDGSVDLGESGRAAMNTQRIQSREGIADKQIGSREKIAGNAQKGAMDRVRAQQGGANYRAGLSQSGQNQRTDKRIQAQYGAGGEYIPPVGSVPGGGGSARERFIQKAIEAGHSREAAEAEATKRKY